MLSRKFIVAFDKLPNVFFGVLPQLRAIKMFKVIFNDRNVLIVHHEVCIRRSSHEARFCDGMILYLFRYFGTCVRIDIVDGQVGLPNDYEESLIRLLIRFRYVSNVEQYGVTIAPGAEHGSTSDVSKLEVGLVNIALPYSAVQGSSACQYLFVVLEEVGVHQPIARWSVQEFVRTAGKHDQHGQRGKQYDISISHFLIHLRLEINSDIK